MKKMTRGKRTMGTEGWGGGGENAPPNPPPLHPLQALSRSLPTNMRKTTSRGGPSQGIRLGWGPGWVGGRVLSPCPYGSTTDRGGVAKHCTGGGGGGVEAFGKIAWDQTSL